MKKVFMVFLGGKAEKANVELHDVVFAVADHIHETYDDLRQAWFGIKEGLHLDSYKSITGVDGYKVIISSEKPEKNDVQLYFIQMGGYVHGTFGEAHLYEMLVASSLKDAKTKAKHLFYGDKYLPHVDTNLEIDHVTCLDKIGDYYISLQETGETYTDEITNLYQPI